MARAQLRKQGQSGEKGSKVPFLAGPEFPFGFYRTPGELSVWPLSLVVNIT